jgi:alpha-glucosidase (family GH31 glycosyl hydrolase)
MRDQALDIQFPIPFPVPGFPSRSTATLSIRNTAPQKRLWWNWEPDRLSYPNWSQFVRRLRQEYNVRVLTYINPFLTDVERGGKPVDSYQTNYFREASLLGYLVKRPAANSSQQLEDYIVSSGPGLVAGMIGKCLLCFSLLLLLID